MKKSMKILSVFLAVMMALSIVPITASAETVESDSTGCTHFHTTTVTAPTCTEKGFTTYICEKCGSGYVSDFVEKIEHNYSWKEIIKATCTNDGVYIGECVACEKIAVKYEDATGHNYNSEVTTQATHTSTGVMTFTCACGDTYTEEIDKIADHKYNLLITMPSCTEKGYTTYICACGDTYVADEVKAFGHTVKIIPAVAATCTQTGLTEGKVCTTCNETLVAQEVVPVTGHTPAEPVRRWPVVPTCTKDGSVYDVVFCSACGEELSQEKIILEATGHADNNKNGYCDTCDELVDPVVICEHNCHKKGITKFFWKIGNFFNRIFRTKRYCSCGAAHY